MCEWCERLTHRNPRWDHHADWRGMYFIFKYTRNSEWHKMEWERKDWRRAGKWVEEHTKTYSPYYGLGGRYYEHNEV